MPREHTHTAIILKKQAYGEGDEIVTLFTQDAGKLRGLAKSVKFARSKLQYSLQALFVAEVALAGRGLPKIIGVEVINSFANMRSHFEALKTAQYAQELLLKFTPDEQPNEALFRLAVDFFSFLDYAPEPGPVLQAGLAKFKVEILGHLGFSVNAPQRFLQLPVLSFSNSKGGFLEGDTADSAVVTTETLGQYLKFKATPFADLGHLTMGDITGLQRLLSGFLRYQLEREIRSEEMLEP